MPNNLVSINESLFEGCRNLASITIPQSVRYIWNSAFRGCESLVSVTLPDGIEEIHQHAFSGCSSLLSISIPESVGYIRSYVFNNCSSLKTIIIPEISIIENGAFDNCKELTDFYCYSHNVPTTWCDFSGSFIEYATLHVPETSIEKYKNVEPWRRFKNIVALTEKDPKPTGIMAVEVVDNENGIIYDLSGRRVDQPSKGLFIMRGKKFVMK